VQRAEHINHYSKRQVQNQPHLFSKERLMLLICPIASKKIRCIKDNKINNNENPPYEMAISSSGFQFKLIKKIRLQLLSAPLTI